MKKIQLSANAKINLSLDVTAKRSDGYHNLATIMREIDLADSVTIEIVPGQDISVTTDNDALGRQTDNLAYRAARLFNDYWKLRCGYRIAIVKRIPIGGGLAGGSADAAAVIKGLLRLHNLTIARDRLLKWSKQLGADVPFCLLGGTALAEGVGEVLTPLVDRLDYYLLLVKPQQGIATAAVFQNFVFNAQRLRPDNAALMRALATGDLARATANMGNVLESVTLQWLPEIAAIKAALYQSGARYAQMTGSGSTVFAIFDDRRAALLAESQMANSWRDVFLARPIRKGD